MKKLAVVGAGLSLALTAVPGVAFAHSGASSAKQPTVKISPSKNVKPGQTIKVKVSHAKKGAAYYCIQIVEKKGSTADDYANANSTKQPKANKKGKFTCKQTFKPFSGIGTLGEKLSCPTTKAMKKKHYSCEIAIADVKTQGQTQHVTVPFTAKK